MLPTPNIATLVEEIRSDAVHEGMDINTVLRKCKVLAGEIGSDDLDQWSTWECLGYPTEQPVPKYRLLPLQLIGKFAGPFGLVKTASVPLAYLPAYSRNFRDVYECRESATLIEHSLAHAENGISTVNTGDLYRNIGRKMYPAYKCVSVRAEVNSARLVVALHAMRDHILNVTNKLLQQHRAETLHAYADPIPQYASPGNEFGVTVSRKRETLLQEEIELEQAWARIRTMNGSTRS